MFKSLKHLIILIFILSSYLKSNNIEKITFYDWDKPEINIFYKLPKIITENTKVIFIIHGNSRNADGYLDVWTKLAEEYNVLLIAPEFNRANFPSYNTLMMATSSGKIRENQNLYLHNSIDILFDFFIDKYDLDVDQYMLYGHSGGSQFVHRYLLFSDNPRISNAVAANAGWYTFLNGASFPYGLNNPPIKLTSDHVRSFLAMELHILIGSEDVDIDSSVNQSDGANAQGKNRFHRANNFFSTTKRIVEENNLVFNWKFKIIKGVAHSNTKMSKPAAVILLEDVEKW